MDYRDRASHFGRECPKYELDEKTMEMVFEITNEDGDEESISCDAVFVVCPVCDGKGKYVNPSIDAHGISDDEFGDDPDFEEAYFGGAYDVPCAACTGKRVVPVPQEKTEARKRWDAECRRIKRDTEEYVNQIRYGY